MPLLDHFHPPLHGPRRWEGFHHAWAVAIASQLNDGILPPNFFAEPEISLGPELEIDVATLTLNALESQEPTLTATAIWAPSRPKVSAKVDFAHLDTCEVRVYQNEGGAELRGAVELVSPANKDREGHRRTFAAKCAGYLQHVIGVTIIDVVTSRRANLHATLFDVLEVKTNRPAWRSSTGLGAFAYRAVPSSKKPRIEMWAESLKLGAPLPVMPLWLGYDLCVPLRLEESYLTACRSLRIYLSRE